MSGEGLPEPGDDLSALASRIADQCRRGEAESALQTVERLIGQRPYVAGLHVIHGNVLRFLGRFGEGAGAFAAATRLDGSDAAIWLGMGLCLEGAGQKRGALQAFAKATTLEPDRPDAFFRVIRSLQKGGHHGKALERLDAASARLRRNLNWPVLRASSLLEQGRVSEAIDFGPGHPGLEDRHAPAGAGRLRALIYDPRADAESVYRAAVRWDRCHGPAKVDRLPAVDSDPERPLCIGFLSTRMRRHSLGYPLRSLLKRRPAWVRRVVLFPSNDFDDDLTGELRRLADATVPVADPDPAPGLARIRREEPDILVDMNEYTNGGRMEIVARRAAPAQVHWYANALTTGLRAMDFRISDSMADPPGKADRWSAERILRLDETGYTLFTPPEGHPEPVSRPPVEAAGRITFGAIHHLAKYNPAVLDAYRRILEAVPGSRLLLARANLDDPPTVDRFRERLAGAGLPPRRVLLAGDRGTIGSLAIWNRIDINLDTWPFSASASAVDALYMGVPLVTRLGDRVAGRTAASKLHLVGCDDLITRNDEDFVNRAVALAGDRQELAALRRSLPARVRRSGLMAHDRTAAAVWGALREAWRQTCAG
ncbi:MAG: tetratricopeptide repeat protein [Opitutales bacterium]